MGIAEISKVLRNKQKKGMRKRKTAKSKLSIKRKKQHIDEKMERRKSAMSWPLKKEKKPVK